MEEVQVHRHCRRFNNLLMRDPSQARELEEEYYEEYCYLDTVSFFNGQDLIASTSNYGHFSVPADKASKSNIEVTFTDNDCADKVKLELWKWDWSSYSYKKDFGHTESDPRWFLFGNVGDTIGRSKRIQPYQYYCVYVYVDLDPANSEDWYWAGSACFDTHVY